METYVNAVIHFLSNLGNGIWNGLVGLWTEVLVPFGSSICEWVQRYLPWTSDFADWLIALFRFPYLRRMYSFIIMVPIVTIILLFHFITAKRKKRRKHNARRAKMDQRKTIRN